MVTVSVMLILIFWYKRARISQHWKQKHCKIGTVKEDSFKQIPDEMAVPFLRRFLAVGQPIIAKRGGRIAAWRISLVEHITAIYIYKAVGLLCTESYRVVHDIKPNELLIYHSITVIDVLQKNIKVSNKMQSKKKWHILLHYLVSSTWLLYNRTHVVS